MARSWSRLTLAGKLVFTIVPVLLLLAAGLALVVILFGKPIVDFLATNIWLVRFVVAATAVLLMSVPSAFLIIYMEMKVIALMNLRIGPDRVGPFGSLLSVVHGLKVLMKEDFSPTGSDRVVFTLAPVVVYMSAVMTLLVIPFAPGLFGQDFNIGLLYLFAVSGLTVVGLLMGGWSSFNKYSLLGGLRSAAQVVSYEIPLTLSIVGLLILAGTMSLNQITLQQSGWFTDWYVFKQPLGALIFFIAEYVNVFVVSGLIVTLFFGGWNAPFAWPEAWAVHLSLDPGSMGLGLLSGLLIVPPLLILALSAPFYVGRSSMKWWQALIIGFILFNLLVIVVIGGAAFISWDWVAGLLWFLGKSYVFVFLFVWMRGTLPRVRIDQLMNFAWKWLLPASLLNLFVTAAAVTVVAPR